MINNISFLNFKSQLQPKTQKNNLFVLKSNITAPKLAPLAKDTVSFTGVTEYRAALNNTQVCQAVHENAKPANEYLKGILNQYFLKEIYDKEANPQGGIEPIQARVKSVSSIEEKISDKIRQILESEDDDIQQRIFSPRSESGIKDNVRDISGARIVVKNAFDDTMDRVVESLCDMIIEENLIITEIENHTSPDKDAIPYFSKEQLEKIEDAINYVRTENGDSAIAVLDKPSKSGYMALHLNIDTRQAPKLRKHQGFYSELQIIGQDVELLKDIEDLCYKLKKGMGIKSEDVAYTPFEKFFLSAYNTSDEVKKAFQQYTIRAYSAQRLRKPSNDVEDNTKDWSYKYPTIEECGLAGEIPPILDFNILARIKRSCDDLYYVENHAYDIVEKINQLPKVTDNN